MCIQRFPVVGAAARQLVIHVVCLDGHVDSRPVNRAHPIAMASNLIAMA